MTVRAQTKDKPAPVSFSWDDPFLLEDQLTEVLAAAHAPFLQHHQRQRAELLQRVRSDGLQQLLAADVSALVLGGLAPGLGEAFLRHVQAFPHEEVGFPGVAVVLGEDGVHPFLEIDFGLHISERPASSTAESGRTFDMPSPPTPAG